MCHSPCLKAICFPINDAITKLGQDEPQAAELVKLRYFVGLPLSEAAKILGLSSRNCLPLLGLRQGISRLRTG